MAPTRLLLRCPLLPSLGLRVHLTFPWVVLSVFTHVILWVFFSLCLCFYLSISLHLSQSLVLNKTILN